MSRVLVLLLLSPLALSAQQQQPAAAPAAAATTPPASPVKLGGYMQTRVVYQSKVGMTATLNRARLQATGVIGRGFSYKLQAEFRTGNVGTGKASVSLTDAYIRWARQALGLQVGQFKTPFTKEYLMSIADIESLDRSTVVDSLAPKRDIGVMADYQAGKHVAFSIGAFNGEGQNVTANKDSTVLGVARATVRPIPELTIGANVARYFGDSTRYGADVSLETARVVARGEWVAQQRDSLDGKSDRGWWALAGYRVAPDVQLVGKYEDFRRDAISTAQRNRAWSAGLNWYVVSPGVRLSAFYVSRKIGTPGIRRGALQTQLQVRF
jgi:phosphate-selective porin